jgi:hypothetical protein
MILQWVPVLIALTGQAAPPPTSPPTVVRPATVQTAPAQTPRPAPKQYDETATARSVIEKAVEAANTDDIRALIIWGANDNPRVQAFDVARRTAGATFFSDEYKVGFVDVGKADKNLDVARQYGVTLSADALPFMTVLDQKGKLVANISSRELAAAEGTGFDNKKVAAFLAKHQAPAPDAIKPFEAAVVQAKKEGKTLFVWYSAPW